MFIILILLVPFSAAVSCTVTSLTNQKVCNPVQHQGNNGLFCPDFPEPQQQVEIRAAANLLAGQATLVVSGPFDGFVGEYIHGLPTIPIPLTDCDSVGFHCHLGLTSGYKATAVLAAKGVCGFPVFAADLDDSNPGTWNFSLFASFPPCIMPRSHTSCTIKFPTSSFTVAPTFTENCGPPHHMAVAITATETQSSGKTYTVTTQGCLVPNDTWYDTYPYTMRTSLCDGDPGWTVSVSFNHTLSISCF